ncbi:MAG: serine/threonine protein kinase [Gemmatimonadetes bacterium]|nr:serine/threonine protein kinase [Gemmatimonadota bacterium]
MSELPASDLLFLRLQEAVAGRYALERELGRGGMGIVYLARDVHLDRLVALKLLPPDLAARPDLRERFLREARTAARLSHPSIVPIHAVEEAGDLVWFVMAYIPGESLGARLRRQGALQPAEAARVLRDAAWALAHAHQQGVVHRDVKPDNILLEAGGRRALLADFGIAAPLDGEGGEGVSGTVGYLSPEQAAAERVDGRSDLYGLGVVGYVALAGRLPYLATTLAELRERQFAGTAPALASVAPHVPRALARSIDRCLAPLPAARFQNGEELAGALEELGQGPSELPAPLRVWLTRHVQQRTITTVLTAIWGIPLAMSSLFMLVADRPREVGVMTLMMATVVNLPWVAYLFTRVFHTRRVLRAGYTGQDLLLALRTSAERRREERAFEAGRPPTELGRLMRRLTLGAFAGALVSTGALLWLPSWLVPAGLVELVWVGCIGFTGFGVLFGRVFPGREIPTRDWMAELRVRFWEGPLGRALMRVAGWRLGATTVPEQVLHRPTEVALGEAAGALFKALPAAQRRDLARLPDEITRLTAQAQAMRRKLDELDDLIAQAAPTTLFDGVKPAGDGGAGALAEARALWAERLRETVTLLESLRLGLLKLHAGSAVPDTLTADLAAARELQERLGLLLEGAAEAERALAPRGTQP